MARHVACFGFGREVLVGRSFVGLVAGMLVVVAAAWCYPAMAAEGLGWAPEGCRGAADALLCFAPLVWSPLPALAWWIAAR